MRDGQGAVGESIDDRGKSLRDRENSLCFEVRRLTLTERASMTFMVALATRRSNMPLCGK